MGAPLPRAEALPADAEALAEIAWVQEFIVGIRQIRGEMDIPPGKALSAQLIGASSTDQRRLSSYQRYLIRLARLDSIEVVDGGEPARGVATALLGDMRILVPLAGVIDLAEERQRLAKVEQRLAKDLQKSQGKLANAQFRANAPPEIVAKQEHRVEELSRSLARLQAQAERLKDLE